VRLGPGRWVVGVDPDAALVPGGERVSESGESCDLNPFRVDGFRPFDSSEMPFNEGYGFGGDDRGLRRSLGASDRPRTCRR
jgi:hypothetical protein